MLGRWASGRDLVAGVTVVVQMPWPPSVNRYWRHIAKGPLAGRVLISREGREFRELVRAAVLEAGRPRIDGRLRVRVIAYPPDRRARDLDNLLKAPLDALQHAGVIADDSAIDALVIERAHVVPDGALTVRVSPYTEVQ